MKNKKTMLLTLTAAALFASAAQGQIAGKNVILVHGFQQGDLSNPPADDAEVSRRGDAYWQAFWAARAEARIDWASNDRVEGRTAERAFAQMLSISQSGLCNSGCVLVTHSTGDLVARYILENQANWLRGAGAAPLTILTTLDFAGAGGGTELADLAVNVAYSDNWYDYPVRAALGAFLGVDPEPGNLGVVNDLQPAVARNIGTSPSAIPHLRFVGGGSSYGGITKPFIKGTDDGVVPLHSACGATTAGSFDSCIGNVDLDGKRTSVKAPGARYYNHYPVLMSRGINHGAVVDNTTGNAMTYAFNNLNANGVAVNFDTYTYNKRAWWQWWGAGDTYQSIRNGDQFSMSGLVYQTLN